jgi:hypothetical protein
MIGQSSCMQKIKITKKALKNFINGSTSRYNAYSKPWVVNTIYGVLKGTEPRKDLYTDFDFTFGQYTESVRSRTSCIGNDYYFSFANKTLSDDKGNILEFL